MTDNIKLTQFNLEYLKALDSTLKPTMASTERKIRREYSILFHTPLHQVYELDFSFVLQNIYEHNLHLTKKNQLLQIVEDVIPSIREALDKRLDKESEEINKRFAQPSPEKQSIQKEDSPKSPEINLSFQDEELEDL